MEQQLGSSLPLTSESAELPSRQHKLPNLPSKSTFAIGGGGGVNPPIEKSARDKLQDETESPFFYL